MTNKKRKLNCKTENVWEQKRHLLRHLGSSCGDIGSSFLLPSGHYSLSTFNGWTSGCAEEITLFLNRGILIGCCRATSKTQQTLRSQKDLLQNNDI